MSVTVERYPADKQGEDIVDDLLTTESLQVERGRQEINAQSTDRTTVAGAVIQSDHLVPGKTITVIDGAKSSFGYVKGWSKSVSFGTDFSISSSAELEVVKYE